MSGRFSDVLAIAEPRRIKASHRRRRKATLGPIVQRYYDPQIGRFLSIDPVTEASGDMRHFNRYAYAYNNPYAFTDPDGRCPNCVTAAIGGGVGFIVGAVVNAGAQYALNGSVDISDAFIAGGSAGLAGVAIGFNPALAANPLVVAGISGMSNVAGSVASDVANGQSINGTKAVVSGVAGALAGPAGSRVGNSVENALGGKASSVVGEAVGAVTGEAIAAGATVAGPAAVRAAGSVQQGINQVKGAANNAAARVEKKLIDNVKRREE